MYTKRLISSFTVFSVALFSAASLQADTLAYWDMQSTPSSTKVVPTTVGAGLTVSDLSPVNLNAPAGIDFGAPGNHYIAWSRSSATGGTSDESLTAAIAEATYFQITLTPVGGQPLTIDSLSFDAVAGTAGPSDRRVYLLSNKTGYTDTDLLLEAATEEGSPLMPYNTASSEVNFSIDLSGNSAFANITDSVSFRFYLRTPTVSQNIGFDNLTVNGALVPEPTTFAFLGFGGLAALLAAWRRRVQA